MALDVIYTNGSIHTQDPRHPVVGALGVHGGRMVSVDDELPSDVFSRVVDLRGATVVPGFHDAHCHLSALGESLLQVDLRPVTVATMDELLDAVGAAAQEAEPGKWVMGQGYDQNHLGGAHPTAEALDAVSPENPVWLWHNSRHMAVVNTAAFEAAGYPGRTGFTVPEGGSVPLDDDGAALGLLEETARSIVSAAMPAKTTEQVAEQIAAASDVAVAAGITSVTEPGLGAPEHLGQCVTDLAAYQLARDRGRLAVRATVMPYLTTLHPVDPTGATVARALPEDGQPFGLDLGLRTGLGDERLRIGAVKVLSDGSLIGRSAYMTEDYAADAEAGTHNTGYLQFPQDWLRRRLVAAHENGWQLAVHAIGDGAVDVALDAIEDAQRRAPREDCRHRIEHFGVASDEQVARAARLGVVPVPQGRFVNELGDGIARAMGEHRTRLCYRMKSLLDAGMEVPASTDAPVVDYPPIANIHDMVNRRTSSGAQFVPQECVTVAEAVRAYTVGSAHASHQEHEKGRLVPGMLADFVVLSEDIHTVDPARIKDVRVTATVIGGEVVHGSV
ncbi:amidohydrolase [Kocuria rhizophila]|uniref:amidohydrolase n=1 Tax=Kocuria rhizophila TaxID=72000 RepID=UPI001D672032|nr:amidohydrolase [Kocuria rhizophila]MCC5673641.1 amidohydrolase [Kocuria rhizophila]